MILSDLLGVMLILLDVLGFLRLGNDFDLYLGNLTQFGNTHPNHH